MNTVLLLFCHILPSLLFAPEPDTHLHVYLPPENGKGKGRYLKKKMLLNGHYPDGGGSSSHLVWSFSYQIIVLDQRVMVFFLVFGHLHHRNHQNYHQYHHNKDQFVHHKYLELDSLICAWILLLMSEKRPPIFARLEVGRGGKVYQGNTNSKTYFLRLTPVLSFLLSNVFLPRGGSQRWWRICRL